MGGKKTKLMLFSTQLKLKFELSLAMKHVYECQYLNEAKPNIQYEAIFNGAIHEQKRVLKRFENSLENRERFLKTKPNHAILNCYPLPLVSIGA